MIVKDPEIIKLIQELGDHYRSNINSKYIKKAFLNIVKGRFPLFSDITYP